MTRYMYEGNNFRTLLRWYIADTGKEEWRKNLVSFGLKGTDSSSAILLLRLAEMSHLFLLYTESITIDIRDSVSLSPLSR